MAQEESQRRDEDATEQPEAGAPLVVERKKKKKKKRKYSRDLKDLQQMERRATKAGHRLARAVADGLDVYRKERNKSARKKKDGAVIDFLPNAAEGLGETARVASKIPSDLARAVSTKRVRRQIRAVARMMQPFRF